MGDLGEMSNGTGHLPLNMGFKGSKFEEWTKRKWKRMCESPDFPSQKINFAISLSFDDELLLEDIEELALLDGLKEFDEILMPRILLDKDSLDIRVSPARSFGENRFLTISTVFIVMSSKGDEHFLFRYLSGHENSLSHVKRIVVVYNTVEARPVFVFENKRFLEKFIDSVAEMARFFWRYFEGENHNWFPTPDTLNLHFFAQGYVPITSKYINLYFRLWDFDKILWGFFDDTPKLAKQRCLATLLNQSDLKFSDLKYSESKKLKSLFTNVTDTIIMKTGCCASNPSRIKSLINLQVTCRLGVCINWDYIGDAFPNLRSLKIIANDKKPHIDEKPRIALRLKSLLCLEDLSVEGGHESSWINFTEGRQFVALKKVILNGFIGTISDVNGTGSQFSNIERLFIRESSLEGNYNSEVLRIIRSRSFITLSREGLTLANDKFLGFYERAKSENDRRNHQCGGCSCLL